MKVTVALNPTAGGGRHGTRLNAVLDGLRGHVDVEVLTAAGAGEALGGYREAIDRGTDALVAIGGDGTFHTAAQAVAGGRTPVGLVPTGTCNDLADALGLPPDPVAAARAVGEALAAGRTREVDLARVDYPDGRSVRFASVLMIGYAASVADRGSRLRRPSGPRRYDVAAVLELPRFRPEVYEVELDGVPATLPAVLFAVGNTRRFGGKLHVCPDARVDDGLLDVATMGPNTLVATLGTVLRLFSGKARASDTSTRRFRVRSVRVANPGLLVCADGEALPPPPFTITGEPGALVVPAAGGTGGGR
ncbi:diacylglycerol/lipid kinase family protein [Saccharothrix xinjiangensis]|uniref:Diacylglycerol/lipid kinase family protein n=1 Tax=Saccharothrix xinjiangensis TaxID=204798 RepID=A0ABV9Y9M7_9PSEU